VTDVGGGEDDHHLRREGFVVGYVRRGQGAQIPDQVSEVGAE
jgi:hypothetical protein